ncbi:helix-turn-helix domain-containing protein [Cohnella sp. GCM10012308]|uniref:AraC family transcriptional regulator n=1 Tax=Cohnella sp. GCM10012308 TaxID=3317329 RepID=UPI00360F6B16
MYLNTIPLDHKLFETNPHGRPEFPIQYYVDEPNKFIDQIVPLHWHFEPEFFVARGGAVKVQIGNHFVRLNPGDGIFINANALHAFEQFDAADPCQCPNIVFSTELIAPYTSVLYQKYIGPIIVNRGLPHIILRADIPWQKTILDQLSRIFALLHEYGQKSPYGPFPALSYDAWNVGGTCFEMQVQLHLNQIWQLMFSHLAEIPTVDQDQREMQYQVRLQQMVAFIQQHFMDALTLQDISNAASVSKSEASRCFQAYLKCAPIDYLLQYRIETAQRLLHHSALTIQEVGLECGFNSSSYFIQTFKKRTGMTPREYRNRVNLMT